MPTRTRVIVGSLAAIALALVAVVALQQSRPQSGQIRIGADITLTGTYGYFGQQLEKGLRIAETEANTTTAATPIELVIRDNRHDAVEAAAIFERMANVDKVSAAISLYSPMSKIINAKAAEYGIPLVTTYTTAHDITNQWTFRDFPAMDEQVPPLVRYAARELHLRTVSAVIFQAEFARDAKTAFENAFASEGGKLIHTDEVPVAKALELVPDAIDKATSGKPDGVFLVLSGAPLGVAIKRLRDTGYQGAILSVIMFDSPEVQEVAGPAANGVYYASIPVDLDRTDAGRAFDARFRAAYGAAPDYMAIYGYTIGQYLIDAARQTGGERKGVLARLSTLDVPSVRGPIKALPSKDIQSPVQLYRLANGTAEAISAQTP